MAGLVISQSITSPNVGTTWLRRSVRYFRLSCRAELRDARIFEFLSQIAEPDLRLDNGLSGIDRRENLLFLGLCFADGSFIAEAQKERLPLLFQSFRRDDWNTRQNVRSL